MGSYRGRDKGKEDSEVQRLVENVIRETGINPDDLFAVYRRFLELSASKATLEEIREGICDNFDRNVIDYLAVTGLYCLFVRVNDEMDRFYKRRN